MPGFRADDNSAKNAAGKVVAYHPSPITYHPSGIFSRRTASFSPPYFPFQSP